MTSDKTMWASGQLAALPCDCFIGIALCQNKRYCCNHNGNYTVESITSDRIVELSVSVHSCVHDPRACMCVYTAAAGMRLIFDENQSIPVAERG